MFGYIKAGPDPKSKRLSFNIESQVKGGGCGCEEGVLGAHTHEGSWSKPEEWVVDYADNISAGPDFSRALVASLASNPLSCSGGHRVRSEGCAILTPAKIDATDLNWRIMWLCGPKFSAHPSFVTLSAAVVSSFRFHHPRAR